MVLTRRRSISAVYIEDDKSSSSSVEVAPPKKLKVSTRRTSRTKIVTNKSPSTSQLENKRPVLSISEGTSTTHDSSRKDWLPHGWTAAKWATSTGHKYTVFKETATHNKFYSKQQVLNYLAKTRTTNSNNRQVKVAPPQKKQASTISTTPPSETPKWLRHLQNGGTFTIPDSSWKDVPSVEVAPPEKKQLSTISTTPSEIPKRLYDLIQNAAKARKSLKRNSNNRFAQRKLDYYEPKISRVARYYQCFEGFPRDWKYDPETSFMAHVPKPPPPPKPKMKKKKKKIKITWSSPNYHGRYPLNNHEQKVWNEFTMSDTTEANDCECFPIKNLVMVQKDEGIVNLLGKFAVDTFNKSCHMYVNKDEDNMVGGVEIMECKFFKLTKKYIFYMTIEAIEQGIHGVYETRIECKTKNGARTLMNFILTDRKPEWNRGRDKTQLESEVVYETVEDGSSDPQDFYKLTGLVHRKTDGGGFNYHNPPFSAHLIIYDSSKDEKAKAFSPNVSQPL